MHHTAKILQDLPTIDLSHVTVSMVDTACSGSRARYVRLCEAVSGRGQFYPEVHKKQVRPEGGGGNSCSVKLSLGVQRRCVKTGLQMADCWCLL